ncbi:MAG TPA: histidine--tRNA ligase [Candidatus Polarisedimenticolaceae bacterium]|nr:histidine--tRNA ligase [Candidatus Polarisedimenticolaceae bacterium]
MAKQFQHVRGMPDILPEAHYRFDYLISTFRQLADAAGYQPITVPLVEEAGVFVRGLGSATDAVDKEMYVFDDRSGNQIALRPEPTAGIVRAYIEHGMASLSKPVKLQIAGPMFRYDRPQAGRQRQFTQVGVEVLGDASSSIDAQVITLALRFCRMVGLHKVSLQLNSLGDAKDRAAYNKALVAFLEGHKDKLADIDRERVHTNPLRVLDSKEKVTQKVVAGAPKILDFLSESSQAHFNAVKEYLDKLGITYEVNPRLVRGLDYYTHTVFELYGQREGSQASLGGGGRYDGLVEQLGGQATPAAGFGLGLERILLEIEAAAVPIPKPSPVKVYVASLGEPARLAAFSIIERLLDAGVGTVGSVDKDGIGAQLERANKLEVPLAVIIGQKEVQEETVIVRDMRSGAQEMISLGGVVAELQQRFK